MLVRIDGRISRASVHLEPELWTLVQGLATKENRSISSWLRMLVLRELLNRHEIQHEDLLRFVA